MGQAGAVAATPRLLLRSWRDDDLAGLVDMDTDPEVMRFIGDGTVRTPGQVAETLGRLRDPPERAGLGLLAIEDRSSGDLLGWTGLIVPRFLPSVMPAVEAGWRLRRTAWGRGIATEAARAALGWLLPQVDLSQEGGELVHIRQPGNVASERVMVKLGFVRSSVRMVDGGHLVVHRARPDELVLA